MNRRREYPCRIAKHDTLAVDLALDEDKELSIRATSETANAHVSVLLTRRQVQNLYELLGNALGVTNEAEPDHRVLWRDIP